jgi:hypothetical protein
MKKELKLFLHCSFPFYATDIFTLHFVSLHLPASGLVGKAKHCREEETKLFFFFFFFLIFFDFQLLRRGLGGIAECIAFGEGIWWTSL